MRPVRSQLDGHPQTYRGLQVLRIVAAVLVLVTHSSFYASERLLHTTVFWRRGACGVDLFFVLSGFVMVVSSARLQGEPQGWKIFAERRIVRIVPMYWLATTVKLAALLFTAGLVLHAQFSIPKTLASYFFLPSLNSDGELLPLLAVGWTLNFEMFFYLLFTLALLVRANLYWFLGIALGLLATGAAFRHQDWPPPSFYLHTIALEFFLGMLIARETLRGRRLQRRLALFFLAAGFFLLLGPWELWPTGPQVIVQGLPAALILWSLASLEPGLPRLPRWLLYLADSSYVIYLFHPLVAPLAPVVLAKAHLPYVALSVICSVSLALAAGCLVHAYVEVPVNNFLGKRIRVRHARIAPRTLA